MDEYKIKSNETVSILPLSDLHVGSSQFNEEFFEEWIKMARRTKNKRIYCLGDMIEFGAKRVGDSAYNQCMSPNDQMDFVVDKLSEFKDDIVFFTNGNHCFDEDTELLTIDGFKNLHEYDGEKLATMNMKTGKLEFQEPSRIIIRYHDGLMKHFAGNKLNLMVTDKHRLVYTYEGGKKDIDKYRIEPVNEITNKEIFIPMSCFNDNEDYNISDDWLRLMAWCLTDSSYNDSNIIFYQRKSQVNRITDLLDDLGFEYGYRERDRNITHICGKELKSKAEIGCVVTLYKKHADKVKTRVNHYSVPDILWKVSKKQFITFLEEMVFCDGSKHKSAPNSSWVLYKSYDILSQVQALCIKHNIRTSITEYRKNCFRLNIALNHNGVRVKNQWEDVPYKGLVWCATVPNDTLICRRNGKVAVTGNCDRASSEFNLNIAKIMADRLDVKFTSGFIDAFKVNDKVFTVNGSHGNTTNARRDLSIGGLIRAVNGIEADIYLRGHNHRLLNYYDFVNTNNGLKKKFYCYTGSFLNYKGSYAEKNGLNPLPAGYMIINIPINFNIKITEVYDDCGGV